MTPGIIPSTSTDGNRHIEGTVGSRIMSILEGLQLNVNQPGYDLDTLDQHKVLRIFHKNLTSCFHLLCVCFMYYMARDAIYWCLGKKGYALYDEWIADPPTKFNWWEFPWYFESNLDTEVRPWVWVYELKAIHKKYEKTPHELVARTCQMASHAQIRYGSATTIEFEVQ